MRLTTQQLQKIAIWAAATTAVLAVLVGGLVVYAQSGSAGRAPVSASDAGTASAATLATATPAASTPATTALTSPAGAPLTAYQGLGSWVDIYDERAWKNPERTIADMYSHGVRTLYVQTSHYHSPQPWDINKSRLERFIRAAHARGMYVVAWYLPNLKPGSVDFDRVKWAIDFRTPDGQRFDSFALDIESSAIRSEAMRNRGFKQLAAKIRAFAGPAYPLGGIIPAPVGLRKETSVWYTFPYQTVAQYFDVILPMGYYTYHGHTASAAYSDVRANLAILRSKPGCASIPVHLIGGESEGSSAAQVAAFVRGVREAKCIGASLYTWPGTTGAMWTSLAAVNR